VQRSKFDPRKKIKESVENRKMSHFIICVVQKSHEQEIKSKVTNISV